MKLLCFQNSLSKHFFFKVSLNLNSHPKKDSSILIALGETTFVFLNLAQTWCKYCQIITSPININSICSNGFCS